MEQSYAGSRISLAAAMASAKKFRNDDRAACVNSKDTGSKKKSLPADPVRKGLGIKFDKHSAGNYFKLIGTARFCAGGNENLL